MTTDHNNQLVRLMRVSGAISQTQQILNLRDRLMSPTLVQSTDTPHTVRSFRKKLSSLADITPLRGHPAHLSPALINRLTWRLSERIIKEAISEFVQELEKFGDELVDEELEVED